LIQIIKLISKKYPNTPNFQQKQNPRIQNSKSGKIKRTESNKSQKYDINTNEFKNDEKKIDLNLRESQRSIPGLLTKEDSKKENTVFEKEEKSSCCANLKTNIKCQIF